MELVRPMCDYSGGMSNMLLPRQALDPSLSGGAEAETTGRASFVLGFGIGFID